MPEFIRCSECNTPIAEVQNGCLVIKARHHGEEHTTVIPLRDLVRQYGNQEEKARRLLRELRRGPATIAELAASLYCFPDDIAAPLRTLEGLGLVRREIRRGQGVFDLVGEKRE